jgi:dCMP deaminase
MPIKKSMQVERQKQLERDRYYMGVATAVEDGADCRGTSVAAVLVAENRIIGTGYNGTPENFPNCKAGGCVRCYDSWLHKQGNDAKMSDPDHLAGRALDRCICVHAEQNSLLTAARFGIAVDGATLYTTQSPCFGCLKESMQVGIARVVYREWYHAKYGEALQRQYQQMVDLLTNRDSTRLEGFGGGAGVESRLAGQPDPYEDPDASAVLNPPVPRLN